MTNAVLALLLFLSGSVQNAPAAFPRDDAKQLIDNDLVAVWDVVWPKGKTAVYRTNKYDTITVDLVNAFYKINGTQLLPVKTGQASFFPKSVSLLEEGASSPPRHAIVVELKDAVVPPLENKSGYPDAFPGEGIKKVLENNRLTVWDYKWTRGKPTPMHFHAKDVVTIYLTTGDIRSTSLDRTVEVISVTPGLAKFNSGNRTHTEELIKGAGRAIIVELK